jgi:hypothetical protein
MNDSFWRKDERLIILISSNQITKCAKEAAKVDSEMLDLGDPMNLKDYRMENLNYEEDGFV